MDEARTIRCLKCGADNRATKFFCDNCGTNLNIVKLPKGIERDEEEHTKQDELRAQGGPEHADEKSRTSEDAGPIQPPPTAISPPEDSRVSNEVVIKDVEMQFSSMVVFMVKWAFASIPAVIIIFLTILALIALFASVLDSILGAAMG